MGKVADLSRVTAVVIALGAVPATAIELCSGAARHTCVVDGDTVWIEGEKIRLADIDAPESNAPCTEGRIAAAKATGRLAALLALGDFQIIRGDPVDGRKKDRFGRTLAVILMDGTSVGDILVGEGLARSWSGVREGWCEAPAD